MGSSTVMPLTLCSLFPAPFNMSSWKLNKNRAQGSAAGMDLDEPKEKRQRQDAGKKGGAKMKKLKEIKDLENLMPTIEVLTKANLNTMQNVRNLQSMTTVSIQISSSHKIVGLMKAAGKEYAAQATQRKTTWDGTTICTHMGTDGGVSFDGLRSGDQADCRAVPKSGNSDYGTSPSPTSLLGRSRSTSSPSCSLQSSRPVLERGHEGGEEVHDHSGTSLPPNISKLDHCSNEVPGQTCGRQADAGTSRTEFSRKTTSRFARMMEFLRLQKWRACSIPCQVESSKCRGQCVFDHHEPHDLHLCKACGKVIDEQQEGHPISDT